MPCIQGVYWLLTIPIIHLTSLPELNNELCYIKGQQEIGEGGLHHWQLLAVFNKKVSLAKVKSFFCREAHVELSRSDAADKYVWKEDTRVAGTQIELGEKPFKRNNKTDWDAIKLAAMEGRIHDCPADVFVRHYSTLKRIGVDNCKPQVRDNINVKIYWGGSGLGKTRRAWFEAGEDDTYVKDPNTKWWDGYRSQKNVIIDEFTGVIAINHILRWLDRYPCMAEVKGYSTPLEALNFWITSNVDPRQWYLEANEDQKKALLRRCSITHFLTEWKPPSADVDEIVDDVEDDDDWSMLMRL